MSFRSLLVIALFALLPDYAVAQPTFGSLTGIVTGEDGGAIADARVIARASSPSGASDSSTAITDVRGRFLIPALSAGTYTLVVRQLGYREGTLASVRVIAGDTVRLRVVLTRAPTQLSTVVVVRSPTAIDALSVETPRVIGRDIALQLPTARDASSVVALVPGAKDGRLWGGAGAITNNFQIDGVSMNHAGVGGDFLQLPRDWVETIEVRGLGANAEFGNFQGGVVNAVTRTGTNNRLATLRTYHEDEALTSSNFERGEIGAELARRTEFSGEVSGAVVRDKLFYFIGAQFMERVLRAPDLRTDASAASGDFLDAREVQRDWRAVGKLTWRRTAGERLDVILGSQDQRISNAGINGLDAVASSQRVREPTVWYEAAWKRELSPRTGLELTAAGYSARERREGNAGSGVPGVRVIRVGNQPLYRNAEFDERSEPSAQSVTFVARRAQSAWGIEHKLAAGVEASVGSWRNERIRTGGLTWRPYLSQTVPFDADDVSTWNTYGSDWGGNVRLNTRSRTLSAFLQDEITLGGRVTVSPGLRMSSWTGWMTPCSADQPDAACGAEFEAVSAGALDPRVGIAWDVTGRNTLAVKAHWGRFHQGMYALLFDRASGSNAYSNRRFYASSPTIPDPGTTFTPQQREALTGVNGFSPFFNLEILNETGTVDGYRQPYVDQLSLGIEKTLGPNWKLEVFGVQRANGNIVGLVDRNLATNYTALSDIKVDQRFISNVVLDADGRPLVLDRFFVSNRDLIEAIAALNGGPRPGGPVCFDGWCPNNVGELTYDPDIVLSTINEARRNYRQLTTTVTAQYARWQGEGSLSLNRLVGNVSGVTGHGVIVNSAIPNSVANPQFTAGPFVRPNERTNADGRLPDATEFEAKLWMTGQLPFGFAGGLFFTHIIGEPTTPTFIVLGRYMYRDAEGVIAPRELLPQVLGQQIFVETRGSRRYASRSLLDVHLEREVPLRFAAKVSISADVFNVLGSRALLRVKTEVDDQALGDPSSVLGAPRQRVAPRSLRLGVRIE